MGDHGPLGRRSGRAGRRPALAAAGAAARHCRVDRRLLEHSQRVSLALEDSFILNILLANYQKGGLEGEALQETFLCCFFLPAKLAKRSNKEDVFGSLRPRWRVSQQYLYPILLEHSETKGREPLRCR